MAEMRFARAAASISRTQLDQAASGDQGTKHFEELQLRLREYRRFWLRIRLSIIGTLGLSLGNVTGNINLSKRQGRHRHPLVVLKE